MKFLFYKNTFLTIYISTIQILNISMKIDYIIIQRPPYRRDYNF